MKPTGERQSFPRTHQPVTHRTIDAFGEMAGLYSATWFDDPVMEPSLNRFLALVTSGSSILDAGCGPGRDVRFMLNKGFEAIGIDLSMPMLEEASRRVPEGRFRRMDIRAPQFPPESFAGIWACASLHHIPASEAALALHRYRTLLSPGGVLAVSVQGGASEWVDSSGIYCKPYAPEEFREVLLAAGFRIVVQGSSSSNKSTLGGNRTKQWLFFIAQRPQSAPAQESCVSCDCVFCPEARFSHERLAGMPAAASVLWGDEDCYVQPDLAPLVEGHLLLVATNHRINFGAVGETEHNSIARNQARVTELLNAAYGVPVLFFEHGPAIAGKAGSCIDHAHLHCVPIAPAAVRDALERSLGCGCPASPGTLRRLYGEGKSYVYLQPGLMSGNVYLQEVLPSQYFRQVMATILNAGDWRWQSAFRTPESKARHSETLRRLLPLADALPGSV